ncbi:hypothetical protein [Natribacillus halophilus]|uniref:Membrane domain of glycerophosphoryl diester phosphodiesterase n=1 Tax=Natribacillus halophilus TaxID=549003 RepID=A0A1G8QBR9_9BACI|nr:hypothetical protein [Natribacillus halophilus]SDJ02016.1 hypothetical protein SAMN04488123_11158 [Natribacillus halophilus]
MKIVKKALQLYNQNLINVLILSVVIVLPLYMLEFLIRVGASQYFGIHNLEGVGSFVIIMTAITILILAQLPFISMSATSLVHEHVKVSDSIKVFFKYLLPVIGSTMLFIFATVAGLFIFVLPGLFLLILTVLHPYVAIVHNKHGGGLLRALLQWSRTSLVDVGIFVLMFMSLNVLLTAILTFGTSLATELSLATNIMQLFVNILILPLFVCVISVIYHNHIPESFETYEAANF